MLPTVSQLVMAHLASRLWLRWFGSHYPNPWINALGGASSRLAAIRQRRAQGLSGLLWWALEPLLPRLAKLTVWAARRRALQQNAAPSAPTGSAIAVGNWIVGGAGKTPVCIALAVALRERGLSPAILTRGYRPGQGLAGSSPLRGTRVLLPETLLGSNPSEVGDEAWLMAWRTGCPVGSGSNRFAAATAVLKQRPETRIWILDDGLSQTSLRPDIRVLVLDSRGHGNGRPLPDGPLRGQWPPMASFVPDAVIAPESLDLSGIVQETLSKRPETIPHRRQPGDALGFVWGGWPLTPVTTSRQGPDGACLALAGIAQPDVFFQELRDRGINLIDTLSLPDHASEILPSLLRWKAVHPTTEPISLVMTEKDAVKFAWETRDVGTGQQDTLGLREVLHDFGPVWWALRLESVLPNAWVDRLASSQKNYESPGSSLA